MRAVSEADVACASRCAALASFLGNSFYRGVVAPRLDHRDADQFEQKAALFGMLDSPILVIMWLGALVAMAVVTADCSMVAAGDRLGA